MVSADRQGPVTTSGVRSAGEETPGASAPTKC